MRQYQLLHGITETLARDKTWEKLTPLALNQTPPSFPPELRSAWYLYDKACTGESGWRLPLYFVTKTWSASTNQSINQSRTQSFNPFLNEKEIVYGSLDGLSTKIDQRYLDLIK